jgi:hypothetical protein
MLMKRKLAVAAVAIVAVFGVFALAYTQVSAQNPSPNAITISISPPVFELSANPGERIRNNIRVTNLSETPQEIFVDKRNFTALGEEGGVDLTEDDTSYSLSKWIGVNKERVTIPAKKAETFQFTISVPANAEPGGHFGSLVFKTQAKELPEGQAGASVGQEVGALLLVKVAGDIHEQVGVASFGAQSGLYDRGPVTFETRTENTGNVHLKPRGTITITNMFGGEVATLQLDERNVLPDAIRKVDTEWNDSSLRFGRYTATLSLVYGSEGTIVNSSTSFFIIPYKLISIILVVAGALAFIGYRYRERFLEAYRVLAGKK